MSRTLFAFLFGNQFWLCYQHFFVGYWLGSHNRGGNMMDLHNLRILSVVLFATGIGSAYARTNVLAHHYDNQRTGWKPTERALTPSNVSGLKLAAAVALDGYVDAQPLVFDGVV
jgi:hypothetical protein